MNSPSRFHLVLTLLVLTGITRLHANGVTDLFGVTGNGSTSGVKGDLISIDLNNNAAGAIIGMPTGGNIGLSGLAFDNSGTLFGTTVNGSAPSNLLTINPTNGSQVGPSVPVTFNSTGLKIGDLANSPLTNLLYGMEAGTGLLYNQ